MFCLNLHRDLDPDPRGLEADDLHVVGHVLPIRMVIALAFFKRIFTRSLPMNQAHGLIIAEVCGTCRVSTKTTFALPRARRRVMHRRAAVSRATVGYLAPIFASLGLGCSGPQRHDLQEVL